MTNTLITSEWAQKEMNRMVNDWLEFYNSPAMVKERARRKAEWDAKPWHEKFRIRASVKIRDARERLGEIIAGRRFYDDD